MPDNHHIITTESDNNIMTGLSSPPIMPVLIAPPSTPVNTTELASYKSTSSASSASIDDELAKTTNESLTMGSSIVTDIDNVSFIFPPRHKLHPGLYVNNSGAAAPTDDANSNPMTDNDDITAVVTSSLLNCHLASMQLYHTAINNHDYTTGTTQNNSIHSNSMISTTIDNSEKEDKTSTTGQCSGVPGFPDFPDCWDGLQEPPSTPKMSNRRKNSHYGGGSSKSGKQKRCCHRRKIHRTAVNAPFGSRAAAASVTISSRSNTGKDMKRNARDERKLRRIVKVTQLKERRRRKRDMGDICRGMAAIKW